jgi:hypothetical protein
MISAQGIWLALLLPTSIVGALCLPRAEARQLGLSLLTAGFLSGLALFAWGVVDPMRPSAADLSVHRLSDGFFEIVDTSIVPAIPLAVAGCICLLATGCRRSGLQKNVSKNG